MHELPVTQQLLDLALDHAEKAGADRVTDLNLVIGALSSIVDESVSFYWDLISEGTKAEGAKLHFRRVPMQFECSRCGLEFEPEEMVFRCPTCDSAKVHVVAGEEFYLDSIDVETGERMAPPQEKEAL